MGQTCWNSGRAQSYFARVKDLEAFRLGLLSAIEKRHSPSEQKLKMRSPYTNKPFVVDEQQRSITVTGYGSGRYAQQVYFYWVGCYWDNLESPAWLHHIQIVPVDVGADIEQAERCVEQIVMGVGFGGWALQALAIYCVGPRETFRKPK